MTITVKFFASLKEKFDSPEQTLAHCGAGMTVADVWRSVSQEEELPDNVLSAVNLEYARADDAVAEGDEVAFFPPVTGG